MTEKQALDYLYFLSTITPGIYDAKLIKRNGLPEYGIQIGLMRCFSLRELYIAIEVRRKVA